MAFKNEEHFYVLKCPEFSHLQCLWHFGPAISYLTRYMWGDKNENREWMQNCCVPVFDRFDSKMLSNRIIRMNTDPSDCKTLQIFGVTLSTGAFEFCKTKCFWCKYLNLSSSFISQIQLAGVCPIKVEIWLPQDLEFSMTPVQKRQHASFTWHRCKKDTGNLWE